MRIIIVGGVAGGMSAATRLRRLDESAEIVVFEKSGHVSFANCGLPYHLGGVIEERDSLLLQNPVSLGRRFGLDVRVRHEVIEVDTDRRVVRVADLVGDAITEEAYDYLVLSTGAAPIVPDIPGGGTLHTLRDMDDLDGILATIAALDAGTPPVALIIGAGFIGLEVAENLLQRGMRVVVVQRGTHVLSQLDPEMAAPIAGRMRDAGIDLRLATQVLEFDGAAAVLSDGTTLAPDIVIAAVGVAPETTLARSAGIGLGESGGILVDELHRTTAEGVFAIGDAVEKLDATTGLRRLIPLAGLANRHGRSVADTIAGRPVPAVPAIATAIVEVTGIVAASVGSSERQLAALSRPVRVIHTHPSHHAGYYPGARPMSIKLIVDPESDHILGAQIVGTEGVDKRIDVIATAMSAGITASGLADLELAYAPQFGSAKDPVNMLGYISRNQADGDDPTVQWHELEAAIADGATLLDVRAAGQLGEGAIPGARHIPVEKLREAADTLPRGPIIVHCRVGQGAHTAQRLLIQLGFDVRNLDGGYLTWRDAQEALLASAPAATMQEA